MEDRALTDLCCCLDVAVMTMDDTLHHRQANIAVADQPTARHFDFVSRPTHRVV